MQQPVYYCSLALRGAEERYPKMEKLILVLVTTSKKLRPYFQAHTVEVPTEYSMKQILHKPKTSGRLIKWAIKLSEFDIRYKPRITVKGKWNSPNRVYGSYPTGARPSHLEIIRGRGCQCPRKQCKFDPDLSRRNRCGIRPQIWLLSL